MNPVILSEIGKINQSLQRIRREYNLEKDSEKRDKLNLTRWINRVQERIRPAARSKVSNTEVGNRTLFHLNGVKSCVSNLTIANSAISEGMASGMSEIIRWCDAARDELESFDAISAKMEYHIRGVLECVEQSKIPSTLSPDILQWCDEIQKKMESLGKIESDTNRIKNGYQKDQNRRQTSRF